MDNRHIENDAELYVFGALDPSQRRAVEAHIATCEQCLQLVGRAEETLLAMEREAREIPLPFLAPRKRIPWSAFAAVAAVAAALAFAIGTLLPRHAPTQDQAHLAMLNSHFSHAQFQGPQLAKVIYPRDRSWYYIIAQGSGSFEVYGVSQTRSVLLGTTTPIGQTSELFVRDRGRFEHLELRENGRLVEAAAIR